MTVSIFASKRRTASLIALALIALVGAIALSGRSTSAQVPIVFAAQASLQVFGDNAGDFLAAPAVGDFNDDGAPDLALGAQGFDSPPAEDNGAVHFLPGPIGPGTGRVGDLTQKSVIGSNFRNTGFSTSLWEDIDGDGVDDALWSDRIVGGRLNESFHYIPGSPNFFEPTTDLAQEVREIPIRSGTLGGDIAIADMDGDGTDDLVYGSPDLRLLFDVDLGSDEVIILFGPFSAPAGGLASIGRTAVIRGPTDSLFGFSVAAGDLTGDGQADLAIIHLDESTGAASVTVLPGPFRSRNVDFEDLASQVTIASPPVSDLVIGDANLDGVNDLLVGTPDFGLVHLIPGQVLGPTCCANIFLLGERLFIGSGAISFGRALAVADYDGDGLPDVLIGSNGDVDPQGANIDDAGSVVGFAAADQGPRINGVWPSIGEAGAGTEVEIWGHGFLNPTVSFRAGATEVEVEATPVSLGTIRATVPDSFEPGLVDVIVQTDIGEARLDDAFTVKPAPPEPPQLPTTRTVSLARGWNLVGWTGATAAQDATATISGSFTTLYTWNAADQSFQSLSSTGPDFLNTLTDLQAGDGVWIHTPNGGSWEQPAYREPRSAPLAPGFNLAMWTGPEGTSVVDAVAGITGQLEVLFTWDAAQQRFLRFSPTGPGFLNDPIVLNFGDGVWLQVSRSVSWAQPPSEVVVELAPEPVDTGPEPATSFQEAESAIVLVDQGLGVGSGFVISETQILTNTHVVAGASSVTVHFFNGEERLGLVTARDQVLDVAVIEVSNLPEGVRRLDWESAETPAPGDGVWVWGFPLAFNVGEILDVDISSLNATLTTGIVSAIQTSGEGLSFVQTDAAIERGNSGGPMVTEDGRVIGISAFEVRFAEGQNFGIDVAAHRDRIQDLLAQ